jgi:hypothetical protein
MKPAAFAAKRTILVAIGKSVTKGSTTIQDQYGVNVIVGELRL